MSDVDVLVSNSPAATTTTTRLEQAGAAALFGVAASVHFSIAIAQTLLVIAGFCWAALLVTRRERFEAPAWFRSLIVLAALTLVSAAFSAAPTLSFADTKQLLLFLIVPITYRFASGGRASTIITITVSAAAASAAFGIFQYSVLDYDYLGMRVRGTLGHYMTYSGLLMIVIGVALGRILFGERDRLWAALVMPALAVAVAVTFTRNAMVGACLSAALLLALKDFRLVALLPVLAAAFFLVAPRPVTDRFVSTFDLQNPTNRDRVAMLREGERMVRAHPFVGVGPNMVEPLYAQYRGTDAVEAVNPHLHNVPVQIAAERGLPALAVWLWFVAFLIVDLFRRVRAAEDTALAAGALAAMTSMLAAGMFEYNFGDSEFLMLLLLVVTLPYAAARRQAAHFT